MMRQYYEIKVKHQDAIVFFRLGDFYEMFEEDAIIASQILGIVLTSRNKGDSKISMCGIPYHASTNYIAKLTRHGKKVAICEQLTDPSQPGIVERGVVRIITPGTTLDEQILDKKASNYICALSLDLAQSASNDLSQKTSITAEKTENSQYALTFADITTGELKFCSLKNKQDLFNELEKLQPAEIIATKATLESTFGQLLKNKYSHIYFFEFEISQNPQIILSSHFQSIDSHALSDQLAMQTTALLLEYLKATQKNSLEHLQTLHPYQSEKYMALDEATIKNLELLKSAREHTLEGSLLGVLDKTITSSGGRLLKKAIIQPLQDLKEIDERLEIVQYFLTNQTLLLDLRTILKKVGDIERMLGRLSLNSGNARDLRGISNTLLAIKEVKELLKNVSEPTLRFYLDQLDLLPILTELITKAIAEEPPLSIKDGGMIQEGFDSTLDEYKKISKEGKSFIQSLQEREIKRTGIHSLKVRFNKVFGYYIEVSNANLRDVPENYTRKQTLANAERFVTPELKEYEEKVLGAEEKMIALEEEIFQKVKLQVLQQVQSIQKTAGYIALIDLLSTFAIVSWENKYSRPQMHLGFDLSIHEGRHPVVEKMNLIDHFISNDLTLNENEKLMLITGPNMGGKSTYLRQAALITLMAHIGIFVPATSAKIPLIDRIFTRVGASDNLVKGQSTFWVEMEETAFILKNATSRSLVVLDEIGRGTSTFDGVSIAWGIMEYLHDQVGAKTIFASHYHELIALADKLPRATNFSALVHENEEQGVVFLYKVVRGGVDKSYGIEVAKLAGLPEQVIHRAQTILLDLEKENEVLGTHEQQLNLVFPEREKGELHQIRKTETVFEINSARNLQSSPSDTKLFEALQKLDVNTLTPLEALNKLHELKKELSEKSQKEE